MQPTVLRALEFDRICEALAQEALTPLGRARAAELAPSLDLAEVERSLTRTTDAVAFVSKGGSLALFAPEDLADVLDALTLGLHALDPLQLIGLSAFLESVMRVSDGLRGDAAPARLRAAAAGIASFEAETTAVRRAIHPSGEVNDDATPALREFRDRLRRQRAKLRSTLEGLTRGRDAAKYLQDQIVTDRHGRYVLVLRAEHRDAMPGIVHGASASGASLYVEPLSTVDVNNEIVALAEREREEVRRILLALTDAFRRRTEELSATLAAAADIDELHAKVQLARRVSGVAPRITSDGRVEFRGARHPLLIPAIRDLTMDEVSSGADPVPTDLIVAPPSRALVISGPNTGGKTVALKAVGLLALMAQSGLLIPVEPGSAFTPFSSIFADIGDEQSISASLSTFSAHIANLVAMDRELALPALILLDEVGSGTDPSEGGALGAAVIDHFRARGALIVATTHDDTLKSHAATADDVTIAAFGFHPETYAPTYKLIYGAPGRSLALEIAQRLGMPASVIESARARRSDREVRLAEHLARVDQELAAVDQERRRIDDERSTLAAERDALLSRESRLTEREAVLKRRMDDKLNERLREARGEVDKIVADLKGKAGSLVQGVQQRIQVPLSTGDIGGLRAHARAALDSVAGKIEGGVSAAEPEAEPLLDAPAVGQQVFVVPFASQGIVRSVSGKNVEVEVRGKRMKVSLSSLRRAGHEAPSAENKRPAFHAASRAGVELDTAPAREIVLVGSTVDEALDRAAKFLDTALLADERRLRIVHGHGTGRLRDALRRYFREHPLVAGVTVAADNEGGDGATIVELKE